jgi:hypothetical protein
MLAENLINLLKEYESDMPVYIDIGNGPLPLEKISLDYINSEEGILVLKSYN